jgi:hypothetical protein
MAERFERRRGSIDSSTHGKALGLPFQVSRWTGHRNRQSAIRNPQSAIAF